MNTLLNDNMQSLMEHEVYLDDLIKFDRIKHLMEKTIHNRNESFQFQEMPDLYLENQIKKIVKDIELKYEGFNFNTSLNSAIINDTEETKLIFEEIKEKYHELINEIDYEKVDHFTIDFFVENDLFLELWNDYLDKEDLNSIEFLVKKQAEQSTPSKKNKQKMKR